MGLCNSEFADFFHINQFGDFRLFHDKSITSLTLLFVSSCEVHLIRRFLTSALTCARFLKL